MTLFAENRNVTFNFHIPEGTNLAVCLSIKILRIATSLKKIKVNFRLT